MLHSAIAELPVCDRRCSCSARSTNPHIAADAIGLTAKYLRWLHCCLKPKAAVNEKIELIALENGRNYRKSVKFRAHSSAEFSNGAQIPAARSDAASCALVNLAVIDAGLRNADNTGVNLSDST